MASIAKDPRNGRWLARWRDPSHHQRKKSFRRKVDAERFLANLQAEMNRGLYLDPAAGKVLIGDYAKVWSAGLSHLKESTAERYRGIVRTHIEPRWGTYRLSSVATSDVAAWVGELSAGGLSASTVRHIHRVFSLIMAMAVQDGRIALNPRPASASRGRCGTNRGSSASRNSRPWSTHPAPEASPCASSPSPASASGS
jgi:hypothetical protein